MVESKRESVDIERVDADRGIVPGVSRCNEMNGTRVRLSAKQPAKNERHWRVRGTERAQRTTPPYRRAPSRPGVYVFLAVGSGVVKIGFSECVSQRLQGGLVGPAGERLGYLADVRGGRNVEKFLHDVFSHRLAFGREWFYLNDGMLRFVHEARLNHRMTAEMCPDDLALDERYWAPLRGAP